LRFAHGRRRRRGDLVAQRRDLTQPTKAFELTAYLH
jgi:hypothetical protein